MEASRQSMLVPCVGRSNGDKQWQVKAGHLIRLLYEVMSRNFTSDIEEVI